MNKKEIPESVPLRKIIVEMRRLLKSELKASSKVVAEYVCSQVAESIAPLYRMIGEMSTRIECDEKEFKGKLSDHESRISELEKLMKNGKHDA